MRWYNAEILPKVKCHLPTKNLDNCVAHLAEDLLESSHERIKVVFLEKILRPIIQPTDQGIIQSLLSAYVCYKFRNDATRRCEKVNSEVRVICHIPPTWRGIQ